MTRRSVKRGALAALFAIVAACGSTGGGSCGGCTLPPDSPVAAENTVYDGMQAYLTESAFTFLTGNLEEIIGQFLPDGLNFPVPGGHYEALCVWGVCALSIDYCGGNGGAGCPLVAAIHDVSIARVVPNQLRIDLLMDISGTIDIRGTVDCDVPITVQNKPVGLPIDLTIDPLTHALGFSVGSVAVDITSDDFQVQGGFLCDIADFFTDILAPLLNGLFRDQVSALVKEQVAGFNCMPCDYYSATGCYDGTACAGDPAWCYPGGDTAQACTSKYQGLDGKMDPSSLLASFGGGAAGAADPAKAKLRLTVAPGQLHQPAEQPMVARQDGGLRINVLTAIVGEKDPCVPECEAPGCSFPPTDAPPPVDFDAEAARRNIPAGGYMLGLGASDRFLDKASFEAWRSGAICLAIDSSTTSLISSNTFSTFLSSLDTLTEGKNAPMMIRVRPGLAPSMVIGEGTYVVDPATGEKRIEKALLTLSMHELALDFYVLASERWFRIFTLMMDVDLPIGLDLTPENALQPIIGDLTGAITNIRATNSEILEEDPGILADLVPAIIGLAAPALGNAISPIALPEVQGFKATVRSIAGIVPRPTEVDVYEHLGIFADLELAPPAPPLPFRANPGTEARLVELFFPRGAARVLTDGKLPKAYALVDVATAPDRRLAGVVREVQYRVDGGLWSTWWPEGRVIVNHPVLNLPGRHVVELRGRNVGDYHSLDPVPTVVAALVDFTRPSLKLERNDAGKLAFAAAEDDLSSAEQLRWRFQRHGVWIEARPEEIDLTTVEAVEVIDEAGNVEHRDFARPDLLLAGGIASTGEEAGSALEGGGCACTSSGDGLSVGALGLLLLALSLRRRQR